MKKQQKKIFDLLKQNGWERASTPDGFGYCFIIKRRKQDIAIYDGFEALGWCEALEITHKNICMQKEDEYYATYLEF